MISHEFTLWIQGYLTLTDDDYLNLQQLKVIRSHAELVKSMTLELAPKIPEFIAKLEMAFKNKNVIRMGIVREFAEIMK
jgi:hypothetical protein